MFTEIIFWGLSLSLIGKILLGVAVVMVHAKMIKEHRIDQVVIRELLHERYIAVAGISLLIIGYILELAHYGLIPGIGSAAHLVV